MLSHPDVSKMIATSFVPAWESLRAAPRVTITVDEDHVIHRTLRGNIAWLVLTPEGRVIDAWPGVYDPTAFVGALTESLTMWQSARATDAERGAAFDAAVLRWHRMAGETRGGFARMGFGMPGADDLAGRWRFVTPISQARLYVGKAMVETPLEMIVDGEALPRVDVDAEEATRSPVVVQPTPELDALGALSPGVTRTPETASRRLTPLERDTVHHLSVKRPLVHAALAKRERLPHRGALTKLLFEELGGVPMDDPWLGFSALATDAPRGRPAKGAPRAEIAWLADLDAARATGRPIALVATIGEIDDFAALADPSVAAVLSTRFAAVKHRLRQAPRLTLDAGPGHRVERTLRGGVVTVLIDPATGRVFDAIPGHGDDPVGLAAALERASGPRAPGASPDEPTEAELAERVMTPAETRPLAIGKGRVEVPLIRAITARDLASLQPIDARHARARELIARIADRPAPEVAAAVFREVLGTDPADPWLGLSSYALDDDRLAALTTGQIDH